MRPGPTVKATGPVSTAPPDRPGAGSTVISQRRRSARPSTQHGAQLAVVVLARLDPRGRPRAPRPGSRARAGRRSRWRPGGAVRRSRWVAVARSAVTVTRAPASAVPRPGSSQSPSGSGCGRRQAWLEAGSPRWSSRSSSGASAPSTDTPSPRPSAPRCSRRRYGPCRPAARAGRVRPSASSSRRSS